MNTRSRAAGLVAVLALALGLLPLGAQTTLADPNDPLYALFDAWSTRGLLRNLPRIRPYPDAMVRGLLEEAAAAGGEADAAEARRYLDILGEGGIRFRADARAAASLGGDSPDYIVASAPGFDFNILREGGLGLSLRIEAWVVKNDVSKVAPYGSRYDRDLLYGTGSNLDGGVEVATDITSALSYGDADLGVRAGFGRASWGPIWDNGVVLGPQAPQSGQFTFSWRSPTVGTDIGFYILQQGWSLSGANLDSLGGTVGFNGQKYLIIHGVNWSPLANIEIGLFESMVWVDRLEPLYFIPLSEYFVSQSFTGFGDNSMAGLSGSLYLPWDLRLDAVGYADDLHFSDMVKGKWDTKWKMAAQLGLSWAPPSPYLQRLALDYTAVLPYTYTHWEETGTDAAGHPYDGALAYTNRGENLGPALDPNSDRLSLKATSANRGGFQASALARLMRHGNASAGVAGYSVPADSTSGNISGDLGDNGHTATSAQGGYFNFQYPYLTGTWPKYLRFLTQDLIETVAQVGFDISYATRIPRLGRLEAGLGYLFEYAANADEGSGPVAGNDRLRQYLSFRLGLGL